MTVLEEYNCFSDFCHSQFLRVGVAVPCHQKDKPFLPQCLGAIHRLNPPSYTCSVLVNKGEHSMKVLRETLLDALFSVGCNVVLSCDADFLLHPSILNHVDPSRVTSFAQFERNWGDWQQTLTRLFWRHNWSGLYSIPEPLWPQIKNGWDGSDTSVHKIVGDNYKFVRRFCYTPMRPTNTFSLLKAIKKRLTKEVEA